jgi:hypothetical protein
MQLKTKPVCFINELVYYLSRGKGKGKAFAVPAMKAFGGSRGIAPLILNLHTK